MDREIAPQKDRVSLSKACSEDVAELGFKQRPAEPPVCGETPPSCTHTPASESAGKGLTASWDAPCHMPNTHLARDSGTCQTGTCVHTCTDPSTLTCKCAYTDVYKHMTSIDLSTQTDLHNLHTHTCTDLCIHIQKCRHMQTH